MSLAVSVMGRFKDYCWMHLHPIPPPRRIPWGNPPPVRHAAWVVPCPLPCAGGGGGIEVRNFSHFPPTLQFSAIFRIFSHFPIF